MSKNKFKANILNNQSLNQGDINDVRQMIDYKQEQEKKKKSLSK